MTNDQHGSRASHRRALRATTAALALAAAALGAHAQSATIYGSLGNFDVVNNTGQDACGFQVDMEGVAVNPATYTFSVQRYGRATIEGYTNGAVSGTRVTWKSPDCSIVKTVSRAAGTPFAGTCYMGQPGYDASGCEHFGVSAFTTKVTSRWLVKDPANPGAYVAADPPMAVPMPYYYVQPAAAVGAPPVVVAEVQAPEPPEAPERFGNAQWMKVFVRQLPREVTLDELLTTNPLVVPMDAAQTEVNWTVVQADPPSGGRQTRSRNRGGSTLDPTTRSVVRRYEMYAYTGTYDPVTNEALCADLTCSAPAANELGNFISAQMAAVNVQGDFITVAKTGSGGGNVDSSDKRIACGSKCVAPYVAGTVVTLTAKANSGSTFSGWTGACSGTALACSVAVNGANTVGATFTSQTVSGGGGGGGATTPTSVKLSVSLGNPGTVTSAPTGINCGTACAASFAAGSTVTLTATPLPGLGFTGWSGACSTTPGPVCTLTMSKDLSTKANFTK